MGSAGVPPASLTRHWRAGTPALPTGLDAYPREQGEHWEASE